MLAHLLLQVLKISVGPFATAERRYFECRVCGTTVKGPEEECPYCRESRIATYEW